MPHPRAPGAVPRPPAAPWKRALRGFGKALGIVGNILDAEQAADEGLEIVARESPEDLPEGTKVPLREADPQMPGFRNPTGYSVEKTGGRVIYRDPFGNEIGRDAAIEGSKKAARTHDA